MAYDLHMQWWGAHELSPDDWELPVVTGLLYAMEGVRAIEGQAEVDEIWRRLQGQIPRRTGWSRRSGKTSQISSLMCALGPVLTNDAGSNVALIAAVDQILSGRHAPSWDGLADALEEATGRDWRGFLLTWVHSGTTPAVAVEVERRSDRFVGTVTSDLPFGTFHLPVQLGAGDRLRREWIPIVDGVGQIDLPAEGDDRIRFDPERVLPLRALKVQRI